MKQKEFRSIIASGYNIDSLILYSLSDFKFKFVYTMCPKNQGGVWTAIIYQKILLRHEIMSIEGRNI